MGDSKTSPRLVSSAANLAPNERCCTCCERPLRGKFAWLELDQRSNTYHDLGGVPDRASQGWFPFGMTCARKLNAAARAAVRAKAKREAEDRFTEASSIARKSRQVVAVES